MSVFGSGSRVTGASAASRMAAARAARGTAAAGTAPGTATARSTGTVTAMCKSDVGQWQNDNRDDEEHTPQKRICFHR